MIELHFLDYEFLSSKIINRSTVENIDKSARESKASDFLESAEKRRAKLDKTISIDIEKNASACQAELFKKKSGAENRNSQNLKHFNFKSTLTCPFSPSINEKKINLLVCLSETYRGRTRHLSFIFHVGFIPDEDNIWILANRLFPYFF